jgi:hypothetical protein
MSNVKTKSKGDNINDYHKTKVLVRELNKQDTSLSRAHEIMYQLIEIFRDEEYADNPERWRMRRYAFFGFIERRNLMTVDIAKKLFIPEDDIVTPGLDDMLCNTGKDFKLVLWEVCCENDFPTGRKHLIERFYANKTVYPQFARWYDKKYNLDIKLKDTPKDMALDLLGWK